MTLNQTDEIDLIVLPKENKRGNFTMIITDAGYEDEPEERFNLFIKKLDYYLLAISHPTFQKKYPVIKKCNVIIQIRSAQRPTDKMLGIRLTPKKTLLSKLTRLWKKVPKIEFVMTDGTPWTSVKTDFEINA